MRRLALTLSVGPFEIPALELAPCESPTSIIEARLHSASTSIALVLRHVPARVHADRPLEVDLAAAEPGTCAGVAGASIAGFLSAHALMYVEVEGQTRCARISVRRCGGGWIARALIRPATWADAASVTVLSFTLAGRNLPCDCLPATLQVGYNHALAPKGAVYAASWTGGVPGMQAALDEGGSTEETDEVRHGEVGEDGRGEGRSMFSVRVCRVDSRHFLGPPTLVTLRSSVRS